ncbi:hypothetical protein GCM10022226_32560 [Sphaerisporangium flaviroseum]|uniref:HTH marR-type domain-containing protein n=1 Tax=Sphaerisporangium flaviroseum TaxID=509199 RepID=A0ABP7I1P0_9ACTN
MSATDVPIPATGDDACAQALNADLGWALGVVFRSYVKAANYVMDDLPGGPRGYQVLTTAARALPATQLAIAQQLGVDRTVMTYLLDDLEHAGLIERQPDPADRRARRIIATDKGHALVADLQRQLRRVEDHVLSALGEPERDAFRDLVRRLATQVDRVDPVGDPCQIVEDVGLGETPAPTPRPRRTRSTTRR